MGLKLKILDYWAAYRIANCHLAFYLCVHVSLDCHKGQSFWIIWPMATSMQSGCVIIIVIIGIIVFCVQHSSSHG